MLAAKKFGPHRFGHRKPEPMPRQRPACSTVPIPQEIMVSATKARVCMMSPLISDISTIGNTSVLDIRKMCCTASMNKVDAGGTSSTP